MFAKVLSVFAGTAFLATARAEHVTVTWHAATTAWESGKPLVTAVRVKIEKPWHIYWHNPGEGGMETRITVTAPDGWETEEPRFPLPKRFKTGGLANFGYEGEVWFPVIFMPGPDAKSPATFHAEISWLACNEDACVPGSAKRELILPASGAPQPTAEAGAILAATKLTPISVNDFALNVSESGNDLRLTLTTFVSGILPWKPEEAEVFPLTPSVADPAVPIRFNTDGGKWTAKVPRSPYAEAGSVKELKLVVSRPAPLRPLLLTWKKP